MNGASSYYADKLQDLKDIFGSDNLHLISDRLRVDGHDYPIVDDVIILLRPDRYPKQLCAADFKLSEQPEDFASDIQYSFGREWLKFPNVLPEHSKEFEQYFDLLDLTSLSSSRVCDLGCGVGRWSVPLQQRCRQLVLIDFSEAIFVARNNMRHAPSSIFFMADIKELPFRDNFVDFLFCLGVLHHLPSNALQEVRALEKYSPNLLIYLYYALDNRPAYFAALLSLATAIRRSVSGVRSDTFRTAFTTAVTYFVYLPFIWLGHALRTVGLESKVPLYDGYAGKSVKRIRQDVYDRFFTRIEQRFAKSEILTLRDTFGAVEVSSTPPYWHFLCRR